MIYTATITTASLRLRESRSIADLLLQAVSDDAWNEAILDQRGDQKEGAFHRCRLPQIRDEIAALDDGRRLKDPGCSPNSTRAGFIPAQCERSCRSQSR